MHRDLKPENILVRSCEENLWDIAVADFGLATFKTGIPLFKRCGTPGFVAPEILLYTESKDFYDEKCDIFSAGAILYMLLVGIGEGSIKLIQTGRPPFTGTDQQKVLQANKLGDPNFNDPQIIASSPKLQALLRNMLQKDPLQRYSALQCLEDPFLIGDQMASLVSHQKELEPLARICSNSIVQEQIDYHPKLIRSDQLPDSLQFRVRRPALNGEVYTVDSLSNKSNNSVNSVGSNQIADVPKQRISRFSQHHRVPAQDQEFNSLQKNFRNPRQDQLHKLAIKNSFRKKMKTVDFQFDSPRPELDPFPIEEENSEVHALMKKANSRLNQIKLSDLINREGFSNIPKAFTPRAKKYEFKF